VKLLRAALLPAILLAALLTAGLAAALDLPNRTGQPVNDFAKLLSPATTEKLNTQLIQLEKETGAALVVATVETLDGLTVEEYAVKLFEKWGIGQKDKNNGVLFLVALKERKVRIEVGYGLEPVITDGRSGSILDKYVVPALRSNDWDTGISAGVTALETLIRSGATASSLEEETEGNLLADPFFWVVVVSVVAMSSLSFMASTKSWWLGGVFGGVAGVLLGLTIGGLGAIIISTIVAGGFGAGMDAMLSSQYQKWVRDGKPRTGMRGGMWGGGFSSRGGGGRSGGFGGFGGGMSGGGGGSRGF
jgi:uncharacterized protein